MSNLAGARDQAAYEGLKALGLPNFTRIDLLAKVGQKSKLAVWDEQELIGTITVDRGKNGGSFSATFAPNVPA